MSKFIELLKLIKHPIDTNVLLKQLKLTKIELLALIAKINKISYLIDISIFNSIKLLRRIDWLDKVVILENLSSHKIYDYNLVILDECDSTNNYIYKNLNYFINNTLVICEYQTNGKGRGNKIWISQIAHDLTFSVLKYFDTLIDLAILPLVIAVAVNRAFKQIGLVTKIKWPNDILLETHQKIAGILIEASVQSNNKYVIIGIGVDNIKNFDRNELLSILIVHMEKILREYLNNGFLQIKSEWLENCIHYNKMVAFTLNNVEVSRGLNIGMDIKGGLLIKHNDQIFTHIDNRLSLKLL